MCMQNMFIFICLVGWRAGVRDKTQDHVQVPEDEELRQLRLRRLLRFLPGKRSFGVVEARGDEIFSGVG